MYESENDRNADDRQIISEKLREEILLARNFINNSERGTEHEMGKT